MYTTSLLSLTVHTIYILRYVANVSIFIKNSTFRSSRPVVDDHNGNFLFKMALQLKYNLISRKWWFKLLPLDVPFCIAKVTPLYVECDHTGLYQFLIIHQQYWLLADLVVHCKISSKWSYIWIICVGMITNTFQRYVSVFFCSEWV